MEMSIFQQIVARQIPADIVLETEQALAFRDIAAQAPTHILVVPKRRFDRLAEVPEEEEQLLGHLLVVARKVAEIEGIAESGFRVVINNGKNGGETVPHLHVHVLGGRPLKWPPG